jgi:integrase
MAIKELTKIEEPEVGTQPEAAGNKKSYQRLTTLFIEALKEPGRYPDREVRNLYLYVSERGSKTWRFIYKFHGRQREAGFGNFKDVPLKAARERAQEGRELLAKGKDPLEAWQADKREKQPVPTFAEAVDAYMEARERVWRSAKHLRITQAMLKTHAKALMHLRVNEITTRDVVKKAIEPLLEAGRTKTALRLRGHIEAALSAMIYLGYASGLNPARWKDNIKHVVPTRVETEHFSSLPYEAAPSFIDRLREQRLNGDGSICVPAYALHFSILTATRPGEALGARWSEIDRAAKVWRLPKERMKAGRAFEVPLSDAAIEIIDAMEKIKLNDLVFPGFSKTRPMEHKALWRLLRRMGAGDVTAHGFRSTFRDWAGDETNFPRHVCEAALGHKVGDQTEQSYRRRDAFAKRQALMQAWAAYISTPPTGADNNIPYPSKAHA